MHEWMHLRKKFLHMRVGNFQKRPWIKTWSAQKGMNLLSSQGQQQGHPLYHINRGMLTKVHKISHMHPLHNVLSEGDRFVDVTSLWIKSCVKGLSYGTRSSLKFNEVSFCFETIWITSKNYKGFETRVMRNIHRVSNWMATFIWRYNYLLNWTILAN